MDGSGASHLTSTLPVSAGWEAVRQREETLGAGACTDNCESGNALVFGAWLGKETDGMETAESSPGMLSCSPAQDGLASAADGAGVDHSETP